MVEVIQGEVKVEKVTTLQETLGFIVYKIYTDVKYPYVMSWGSNSITILTDILANDIDNLTPADYTVVKFPERRDQTSMYWEDKYCVYFVQFSEQSGEYTWRA